MLIELGLTALRPGYEWRIGVCPNGLRSLFVHSHCCMRYVSGMHAYRDCKLVAISLGFEFDEYGYVTNWYSVPGAGAWQHWQHWQQLNIPSETQASRRA